ncbi:MAG: glycosyltransferase family 87 protein [Gemmatimonadales bacterium]
MTESGRRLAWAAAVAMAVGVSLWQLDQRVGTDFHVFWQAGRDFLDGRPLYQPTPGARSFIYPPFAAMVFQVLGLFPLPLSAVAFHALSVGLIGVVAIQSVRLAELALPGLGSWRWPLALALAGSFHLLLNNLKLNQVNLALLALCLGGLLAELRGRSAGAAALLVIPTLVKLTAGIFLLWLLVRGRRRTLAFAAALVPLLLVSPLLQRGPARGLADYREYYATFLADFAQGRVAREVTNQGLAAAIDRALVAPEAPGGRSYVLVPAGRAAATRATQVASLAVLAAFVLVLLRLALAGSPVNVHELAAAFAAMHLVSPLTWKAHLVSMLFVFFVLLATPVSGMPPAQRWLVRGLGVLCVASGFAGRDVLGREAHRLLGGYSFYTWLLLALLGAMLWLALRALPAPAGKHGFREAVA